MLSSATEKKSSFAAHETAMNMGIWPVTSEDEVLYSGQDVVGRSNKDSNHSFTEPSTGLQWTSSNWREYSISPEHRLSFAEVA